MTNFVDSFNEGLALARKTGENNEEINLVFSTLHEQIHNATEKKVFISLEKEDSTRDFLSGQGLLAKNGSGTVYIICRIRRGEFGYPVTLRLTGTDGTIICEDKEALEVALAEILKGHSIGKKFLTLMEG